MIECVGLAKRYKDKLAVDHLNLCVNEGEVLGLLGANGAGKTTTLRMILGLIHPTSGEAHVLGHKVPSAEVAPHIGSIIEEPAFYPWMSGRKNLEVSLAAGPPVPADAVDQALKLVGLDLDAHRKYKTYSQGMRQRLGLALAVARNPKLLILDEPTNGLDPEGIREFRQLFGRLAEKGTTILFSSHLLTEVEKLCDRVGVIHQGRLLATGGVDELILHGDTLRVTVAPEKVQAAKLALGAFDVSEESSSGVLVVSGVAGEKVSELLASYGVYPRALEPEKQDLESMFTRVIEAGKGERDAPVMG